MGNGWKNTEKSKEEVESNIITANQMTQNELFMKKTGLFLKFTLDINPITNIFTKNIIKVEVFKFMNNLKYFYKDKKLTLSEFYNFYNCLINSTHIFYENKLKQKFPNGKKNEENDICPICEENKVSIMLDCYHFFCEKCIKTWLFDKKNSCPLCRLEIDLNRVEDDIKKSRHWNVIDNIDPKEYDKDESERFENLIQTLFK